MNRIVVSIGRQFGSGGRAVGRKLAERLGVPYYDKELITLAAKESGIADEFFARMDEHHSSHVSILGFELPVGNPVSDYDNVLSSESLFTYQSDAIRRVAQSSCVIVGRCSDYVLREDEALFSVFLSAPMADRMANIRANSDEYAGLSDEKLETLIGKTDKMRASYYNFYANNDWGDSSSYDLCINTSVVGIDGAVELILKAIELRG